jgi:ribosomal protein L19E
MKGHYLFNDDTFDFADITVQQSNNKTIKQKEEKQKNRKHSGPGTKKGTTKVPFQISQLIKQIILND